jgi:DNA invertase Pin-like site-specific DNA recombinase
MMLQANVSAKVTDAHLERAAVVYLRQSTEKQVRHNGESLRLQYALKDRARELGFTQIRVIDTDLGSSAAVGAASRVGFDQLVASVAIGEVGMILSREVSRLSRTDKDWARLMEVCQHFGTLIADAEQIYYLNLIDDQLVLGIKGTLSVVELSTLRLRMQAGMAEKARRGEFFNTLPPGYVLERGGRVVKSPDRRVVAAIELVFAKFSEIRSIRQTFLWFRNNRIELPVNKGGESGMAIRWQLPTCSFIKDMLQNPFYTGAYVWGRRRTEKVVIDGQIRKRQSSPRQPEACRVFIREHHEGYTGWQTYEENRRIMQANALNLTRDETVGAARAGHGILAGLLRCGRCGRKLHVRYWGRSGTAARYVCIGDFASGGSYCVAFGGSTVDRRFSRELLAVITPLGVEASLEAARNLGRRRDERHAVLARQLEELQYEQRRAFEQYNEVDPRNRLVAAELERRWNAKLEEVGRLEADMQRLAAEAQELSAEEEQELLALGRRFADVWNSEAVTPQAKKRIIRTVVEEIMVDLDEETDKLTFTIHWKGGTHTQFRMDKPASGTGQKTAMEDVEIIRKMGARYGDDETARVLNKLGRTTGKGNRWNEHRVATVRRRYQIPGHRRKPENPELLTLGQAAVYCGVSQTSIKRLVAAGVLAKAQIVAWAPWEIKREDLDTDPVRAILKRLRETGKLELQGDDSSLQNSLFITP